MEVVRRSVGGCSEVVQRSFRGRSEVVWRSFSIGGQFAAPFGDHFWWYWWQLEVSCWRSIGGQLEVSWRQLDAVGGS